MDIRSPKLDELARRLARATGEDVETALSRAIEERLTRLSPAEPRARRAALLRFFEAVSGTPQKDPRPIDEIVGYGPDGLPS